MQTTHEFLSVTQTTEWATIDDLVSKLDASNFWDEAFDKEAVTRQKKVYVRHLIKTLKDDSGWPLFASVRTKDAQGQERMIYKQGKLFDPDDYFQVVNYHHSRARYHIYMATGWRKRAKERLAMQIPLPLNFTNVEEMANA